MLHRSDAVYGDVLRDLGPLPDVGVEHNHPITASEWVVVAESISVDAIAGFDAMLQVKAEALEQDGIPYAYDPYAPGADMDVFGMPQPFKLSVPAEYAGRAQELLDAIEKAPVTDDLESLAEPGLADSAGSSEEPAS